MPTSTVGPTDVELLFPVWVPDARPEAMGSRVPRWAVQLDGRTVQLCVNRTEAEAYAQLLRDIVRADAVE